RRHRDAANTAKLLEALENVPDNRRTARFICHLALAEPGRMLLETTASVEGVITAAPKGENGFGYDPVFLVPRFGRTIAEMPADLKNSLSHRGQAARQLAGLLARMLGQ
ncbi:MAG TPA: non-canonical purine NTP pyrophosphatase, partial [Phycisphaerae bacterium]|nr:non-canonical purine NTP pyrophosphatase [Phycisphaerae bacterium]